MTVTQADSSYTFIEKTVRRLTASASQAALTSTDIEDGVNRFYTQYLANAIKVDQQRFVYKFLTIPNVDRYPVDVNKYQGFRAPVYFEGIQGSFFKDRTQLFNLYPRFPTLYQPASGDGVTTSFSFNLFGNAAVPYPQQIGGILSTQVVVGGIDVNGNPIRIIDDGGAVLSANGIGSNTTSGRLLYLQQNAVGENVYLDALNVQQRAIPPTSPLGSEQNANLPNSPYPPSPLTPQYVGTVNYITTAMTINFPVAPAAGSQITVWASTYQPGRPYNLLFWNNEFTIRPVPDKVYLVEVEAYQTPVQFMMTTNHPLINQWGLYIAYGAAMEILRQRQDMEGVENLREGFELQEGLVLEKQGVEEIGQPNITMFNTTQYGYGMGWGYGPGF